jgi:hypothetical protein
MGRRAGPDADEVLVVAPSAHEGRDLVSVGLEDPELCRAQDPEDVLDAVLETAIGLAAGQGEPHVRLGQGGSAERRVVGKREHINVGYARGAKWPARSEASVGLMLHAADPHGAIS